MAEDVFEQHENQHENRHENQHENEKTSMKTSMKIIEILLDNPQISIPEMAALLNMSVSGIRYQIGKLKKTGALERVGADKGGYWKINEKHHIQM